MTWPLGNEHAELDMKQRGWLQRTMRLEHEGGRKGRDGSKGLWLQRTVNLGSGTRQEGSWKPDIGRLALLLRQRSGDK